ncbi:hypothetical protein UYO_2875 [Lachnospiraceae bacterium JC7]|nr:hypothetical protein UYO_2875 [Lachnospiraceae bacterium JC7]
MLQMQVSNPTNAIGMAKELIESCCKTKNERSGIKASESVPFLSTYLGHDSLYETEKYLKYSGNYFEDTLTKFDDYSGELFPEVIIYE